MDKISPHELADRIKAVQQRIEAHTDELPPLIDPAADPETPPEALQIFRELTVQIVAKTRELEIPEQCDFGLGEILGEKKGEMAQRHITSLYNFLKMPAMLDMFKNDHDARRKWRESIKAVPGKWDLYDKLINLPNQLRVNNMAGVRIASEVCGHLLLPVDHDLSERVGSVFRNTPGYMEYGRMDIPQKIQVVRQYQDGVAEALNALRLKPGKTEKIKVT